MLSEQSILGLVAICLLCISTITFRSTCTCTKRFRTRTIPRPSKSWGEQYDKEDHGSPTKSSSSEIESGTSSLVVTAAGAIAFLSSASNVFWAYVGPEQRNWVVGWGFLLAWVR
jgi:hypothetical protein